jgi:hypothetical protein
MNPNSYSNDPSAFTGAYLIRLRDFTIEDFGRQLAEQLPGYDIPYSESDAETAIQRRARNVSLGEAAWRLRIKLQLEGIPARVLLAIPDFRKRLRSEYRKIVDSRRSVLVESNKKAYDRHRYQRRKAAESGREIEEWTEEIRDGLVQRYFQELHEQFSSHELDPAELIDGGESPELAWLLDQLTPSERRGLLAAMDDEPYSGTKREQAAERQRRSRAIKKARAVLSQNPELSDLLVRGRVMRDTVLETLAELSARQKVDAAIQAARLDAIEGMLAADVADGAAHLLENEEELSDSV